MKTGIHPTFYEDALVICGTCGTTWHTGATKKEIHVDVCSNCHPFYTGTQRIVDTAGQVERFTKRLQARESVAPAGAEVKPNKKERRRIERAKRSGMLEAMEPEPQPTPSAPTEGASAAEGGLTDAAKAVGEAVGTAEAAIEEAGKTIAGAVEAITSTVAPRPPRERRPRPPRERRPRAPREERGGTASAPQASAAPESAPAEASAAEAPSAPEANSNPDTGSSETATSA